MTTKISPFIAGQFPATYREDGEFFVEFVKSYYRWLEETGNPLYHARRLPEYFDIDTTADDFLIRFRDKYLPDFALLTETDKRTLVKHAVDIYRSKGSIRSLKLLFKLVYNDEIDVHWPGDDILRPSDSKYKIPRYLEVTAAELTSSFIGKEVRGETSGARAIVESVSRRNVGGTTIDVMQITNVRGQFLYDELVTRQGTVKGAPRVIGSLTGLRLVTGGRNFYDGEVVDIISDNVGFGGKAKIVSTVNQSGQVQYELIKSGAGYSNTSDVYVSERVLEISNIRKRFNYPLSTANIEFVELETVSQPLVMLTVSGSTGVLTPGNYLVGANTTADLIALGAVATTTQNSTSYANGIVVVSDRKAATITLDSITSPDPFTLSFNINDALYQRSLVGSDITNNTAIGIVVGANSSTVILDVSYGDFVSGYPIYSTQHATTANAIAVDTNTTRFTDGTITQYKLLTGNFIGGSSISASIGNTAIDRTATAQYIGSNATHMGVINISPTAAFIASNAAYVVSTPTGVMANVEVVSSGIPGSFSVASLADTETLYLNTDRVYDKNILNVRFSDMMINATSYGFAANGTANVESPLFSALTFSRKQIGSIAGIGNIDPGSYNTIAPFVLIRESTTAPFARKDYGLTLTDRSLTAFIPGEAVYTSSDKQLTTITFTDFSGNTQFNETNIGETVYQIRSDGSYAYGTLITQDVSSPTKNIVIGDVYVSADQYGPHIGGTFDTSNDIIGSVSGGIANNILSIDDSTVSATVRGQVNYTDGNDLYITRTRFNKQDVVKTVVGAVSGATANVISYFEVSSNSAVYGMSASVKTDAGIGEGVAIEAVVVDSGFAYTPNESVRLQAANNNYTAAAVANVLNHGVGQGYWDTTDSFISDVKKIQDSEYYQELSYEIRSSLSKVVYERKVKDIAHVSGTKMFGAVYMSGIANGTFGTANVSTEYDMLIDDVSGFNVGDTVEDETSGTQGIVMTVNESTSASFDGYNNVVSGAVGTFNSNTDVIQGFNSPFNAELSVNEGTHVHFNANTEVIQSVNFTMNALTAVSNVVTTTFNSSSNVLPGIFLSDFGSSSILPGNTLTFDANATITSLDSTFNANTSVAPSTTITFNANSDINSGKQKFNALSAITPAWSTSIAVNSAKTKTVYYDVLDHYNPVVTGTEEYWEDSFGYNTVVTGTKQVQSTRPVTKTRSVISGYQKVLVKHEWGVTGTTSVWVSSGKSGGHYETQSTYGWIDTYRYDPVYVTQTYTDYETYLSNVDITTQVKAMRTRNVYRYDPVYRQESYQTPDTETIDYFSITDANTYISVGDLVRYHVASDFGNTGGPALTTFTNGRLYTVESANTTAIRLRDHTIVGAGNTLPIAWKKIYSNTPISHNITLVSGKSITGANSFIAMSSANSYFQANDAVTYSSPDGYGTLLLNHSGLAVGSIANNSTLYVQFANASGLALTTTLGGTRLALTAGVSELHTLTGYDRLAGTVATATASQFANGDTVIYRVLPGNNAISQIQHLTTYYIQFANSSHIALSRTATGQRIPLVKGLSESGHVLVSTKAGNGVISISDANTKYKVGDSVRYLVDAGNTALEGLTNNQVYYIQTANSSTVALSEIRNGTRIQLTQGVTESGHHLVGTNEILVDNQFVAGDFVQYIKNGTAISNLASNAIYRVSYSDNHTLRLSNTNNISSITVTTGGTGYSNDDVITITDKNPAEAAVIQLSTNSTGGITSCSFITHGLGYQGTPAISLLRVISGGTGAVLTPSMSGTDNINLGLQANGPGHRLILVNPINNVIGINGAGLNSNSSVLYYVDDGYTPISGLTNNSLYYVDSSSSRGISLKSTQTGARISLTKGNDTRGHYLVLAGANNTIRTSMAADLTVGDMVQYSVDAGNTAVKPLQNRGVYYVYSANSTHISLSATSGGPRLTLVRGKFETGHHLYKVSGNSAVIATSYAANLATGDVLRYVVNSSSTPISPLVANGEYYVQFANSTHIALANTENAPRLWMTVGSDDTGHRFIGQLQKSTIVTTAAKTFTAGERVKYVTATGNTALTNFTNGSVYYVQFANDSHIAFSLTRDGDRIDLFKGGNETGHWFSPTSTQKSTIRALNYFEAGDTVEYAFTSSNTGLIGVANNTTYYVEFANASHFAVSTFAGGPRVDLRKGVNEAGHSIYTVGDKGTIDVGTSGVDFTEGDQVRYFQNTGHNLPGIIHGGVYYIQYANSSHIALSPTVGGFRIPINNGVTETGHKIVKTGPNSLIETSFASRLSVNEPVVYTSNDPLSLRPSGALVSGTTYYVEFANATHVAISTEPDGERLTLVRAGDPSTHTLTDAVINNISVSVTTHLANAQFTPGGNVVNIDTTSSQTINEVTVLL